MFEANKAFRSCAWRAGAHLQGVDVEQMRHPRLTVPLVFQCGGEDVEELVGILPEERGRAGSSGNQASLTRKAEGQAQTGVEGGRGTVQVLARHF